MAAGHGVIGIFFIPTDGFHWAEFLQQKLREDGYNIQSILLDLTSDSHSRPYDTNILLVSPEFFKLKHLNPLRLIDPHKSLMVLLGTEAIEVQGFMLEKQFSSLLESITLFETQATEDCVKHLLIGIIKLYEHVHENTEDVYDELPNPKPVPVTPERSKSPNNDIYRVAVSYVNTVKEVFILCNRKGADEIKVELSDGQGSIKAIHENKAIYRFSLDKNISSQNLHFIAKDGPLTLGTGRITIPETPTSPEVSSQSKLDILQKLLGEEEDPICLMCQALNIKEGTVEALDHNLAKKCQSLEPLRRFDRGFFDNIGPKSTGHSDELWPTLLHFAAKFNLQTFTVELLKFPWSMDACFKMNKNNDRPLEIANREKHIQLSERIRNFMDNQEKNGNVPGNKDSGVVTDENHPIPHQCSGLKSSDTYQDMSMCERDSAFMNDDECDNPLPSPHTPATYVNYRDANPAPCRVTQEQPSAHPFKMSISGESETDSLYMPMSEISVADTSSISDKNDKPTFNLDSLHRSKSESQANLSDGENDADEEYEEITDNFPEFTQHYHESHSLPTMTTVTSPIIHEMQLSTPERQSGFFKKFKLFGKHKKDKSKIKTKKRDRKMSLPDEVNIKNFQMSHSGARRGSVQQVTNRDSSSSSSSSDSNIIHSRETKSSLKSLDPLVESRQNEKKKHFLQKDSRKSMRITKAIGDQINPLPLPVRSKSHLLPPSTY